MGDNSRYQNTLKRGDESLIYHERIKKFFRKSSIKSEFPDGTIQIVITLSPMVQINKKINGKDEAYYVDASTSISSNNNAYHQSLVSPEDTSNNNNNNNNHHHHEVQSMDIVQSNIVIRQEDQSIGSPKSKRMKRKYTKPPALIPTSQSSSKRKRATKYTKTSKLCNELNTTTQDTQKIDQQNNTESSTLDYELLSDMNTSKAILRNLISEKYAGLVPTNQKPSTSKTALASLSKKIKAFRTVKKGPPKKFNDVDAQGEQYDNNTARAKDKKSWKHTDGVKRQRQVKEYDDLQQKINAEEEDEWKSGYGKFHHDSQSQNTETAATTASSDFTFSYERIGRRYRLRLHNSSNENPKIKEKNTNAPAENNENCNTENNNINESMSEKDLVNQLKDLEKEEGTSVVGVFVMDGVSTYDELAKQYNVIPVNSPENNSNPPPMRTFSFADSPFDLPYLITHADGFGSGISTRTLIKNPENIKMRFQNEDIDSQERPVSYLCTLCHVVRGRLVMTVLTRTSTTPISTTVAGCIKWCPSSDDAKSTWGVEAHQPKFSRDLVALGGNLVGHKPKLLYRNILNEAFPNSSQARRVKIKTLKAEDEVYDIIMHCLLDAYYEALENEWIQIEMKMQQTVLDKRITDAVQGTICEGALVCGKCEQPQHEISEYRFHVFQCQFHTDPDDLLKIPSLARIAAKFKRDSKKDDEQFQQALQVIEDQHPELLRQSEDQQHDETVNENGPSPLLEPGEITRNEIPAGTLILMNICQSQNFVCQTCFEPFQSFKALQQHIDRKGCTKLPLIRNCHICVKDDCFKAFRNRHGITNHTNTFHQDECLNAKEVEEVVQMYREKKFICHECDMTFDNYTLLARHTSNSFHVKVYKFLRGVSICTMCFDVFPTHNKLTGHKKIMHPNKSTTEVMDAVNEPQPVDEEQMNV